MSKPQWPAIKADYVENTFTLAQIEAKWGVPRGTLSARATREKWSEEKQQFAAKLVQARREKIIEQRAADQEQFENNVLKVANFQLAIIGRELNTGSVDAAKLLKLANALETVQRIGSSGYEKGK